jgi:6-phosphofructokinase 1
MEGKLAILVGGGPAPGINSVIGAATIRSALQDVQVVGIQDGFEWLMQGNVERARPLNIEDVSRIHFRGGSILGTSRANPTKNPKHLDAVVDSLMRLGVTRLITIGGDDTAFSASRVAARAGDRLRVVHVPKTIDNDLDLPPDVDTFGFQTARHVGAELVKNLMVDAFTTSRWYFVISMGRKAGHLALGMGKAAGATLTLVPEEFGEHVPMRTVVDTLVGAVVKRKAYGREHGVAVIAEGVVLSIDDKDLGSLENVERDEHGHVRIAEVDVGDILKRAVRKELEALGLKTTIVAKDIGYELRCADPIPYDMEYTRDLGYCAARYVLSGGHAAMVSMQEGRFVPVRFDQMMDPETGRTRVRLIDVKSARYGIARRYMIRVRRDDFDDPEELTRLAKTVNMSTDAFRRRFEPLTESEPAPLDIAASSAG